MSSARECWTDNNNGLQRQGAWLEISGGMGGASRICVARQGQYRFAPPLGTQTNLYLLTRLLGRA
jgi:hypothetical protein